MTDHIEDFVTCQRRLGDRADFAASDPDVSHSIESTRRIHHATIGGHEVVCGRLYSE